MVTAPALTPVTTPEREPTVALVVLLLVHKPPPAVALFNGIVRPWHTAVGPVIGNGVGLTTRLCVMRQPVGNV